VFHKTAQQIVEKYDGKVAWVYRHFPLEQLHPKAKKEAEAMECVASLSNEETFWKYADMIYEKTGANNKLDIGVYNTPSPTPRDPQTGKPYYAEKKPRSTTDAGQLSDFAVALGVDKVQFEQCMQESRFAERVQRDLDDVIKAGGTGTPTSYIVVKGKQFKIEGAQPLEAVVKIIDEAL
jgi:protein-disulfide isomerase